MNKRPDPKDALQDESPAEETELMDQFIRKMKLQNRILKKLTEDLEGKNTKPIKKNGK